MRMLFLVLKTGLPYQFEGGLHRIFPWLPILLSTLYLFNQT